MNDHCLRNYLKQVFSKKLIENENSVSSSMRNKNKTKEEQKKTYQAFKSQFQGNLLREEQQFFFWDLSVQQLVQLVQIKKQVIEKRKGEMESKRNKSQKKNGKWKKTEHSRFIRALQKYGKNWVQIQEYVKTRTLEQVRSHAQKMFMSMSEEQKKQFNKQQSRREKELCRVRNGKLDDGSAEKKSEVSVQYPIYSESFDKKHENDELLKMEDEKNQSHSTPSICENSQPAALQFHSRNQHSYFFTALLSNYKKFDCQEDFFNKFSFFPISSNPLPKEKQGMF